jgi:hypothetical protein
MGKRKDRHSQIIKAAQLETMLDLHVTQFHTAQKMPRPLRGVPDLYLVRKGISWWIEIKPRYANYVRDQMSDDQWTWFHMRYFTESFGEKVRYGIATDADEINKILTLPRQDFVYLPDYHWGRYDKWRMGR